jgi:hypothetical protein
MPVIFSNPQFPLQAGPNGQQAYVQQLNFRQMINQVTAWNPSLDLMWAGRFLNDAYREVVQRRNWYALKVRGSINIPSGVNGGQASVTQNSNIVQGIGTSWTTALIGQQFRMGFTYPYQTIYNVNTALQQLTVDIPFGGPSSIGGYQIVSAYQTMGANFVRFDWAVNQQQGWPMEINVPCPTLNTWDVWRQSLGWSTILGTRAPTADGQYQIEVWPTPYQQQVFPFEGWIQPPDMQDDTDSPASFIRSDLLVKKAVSWALLFGGRTSKYYDPQTSARMEAEYVRSLESMENADNALDNQDVTWDYGFEDGRVGFGPGSTWAQSHDAW